MPWLILFFLGTLAAAQPPDVRLNLDDYNPACGIGISQTGSLVRVTWPAGNECTARMVFDLEKNPALIRSIALGAPSEKPDALLAQSIDPVLYLRVGPRDLAKRGGWTIFFDRMHRKPSELFPAQVTPARAKATSKARRATLSLGEVAAGPFAGDLRWTFYAGHRFILMEAVMATEQDGKAYLYDMGLVCRDRLPEHMIWNDAQGQRMRRLAPTQEAAHSLKVAQRRLVAAFKGGCLAVFPPPHRYFYPLDFSNNYGNFWSGPGYGEASVPFGFGIRHDPEGDSRFVPWFNAPPGTQQEMGMFLYLSEQPPGEVLENIGRLTRHDRFAPLPGHKVFTSHYHVEHTQSILDAQDQAHVEPLAGRTPTGDPYVIPKRLVRPGFVTVFRNQGIDMVHLAEFHFGRTPRMNMEQRLRHLGILHSECRRLSDDNFLLLPGEEPNVHFGGHWISLFPKPVYWVLNRPEGTPFVREDPQWGRIYQVGNRRDVLELLKAENGLAWTAHPRIKGSTGFPDAYRQESFFKSDRFLGAAWKAMPADLSVPRLGTRVLDLLDDMANWGEPKYVLGEVDVFKIEPDHELYAHMNVNYLRLDDIPRFDDGWQPVLDVLRDGAFFVTTGEVLIPRFTVNDTASGGTVSLPAGQPATLRLDLEWTFPLDRAVIISGDGESVRQTRLDLSRTSAFGRETFRFEHDLSGQRWVRVEVWDIATNGAFTQPVWLQ